MYMENTTEKWILVFNAGHSTLTTSNCPTTPDGFKSDVQFVEQRHVADNLLTSEESNATTKKYCTKHMDALFRRINRPIQCFCSKDGTFLFEELALATKHHRR
ncbi:hypothetical protein NQD34_018330 [Periophthalmus magnuspinnatus]|nr:hypothetical protein NQD34_018330 [Periophthalmus magnuspinnatus]